MAGRGFDFNKFKMKLPKELNKETIFKFLKKYDWPLIILVLLVFNLVVFSIEESPLDTYQNLRTSNNDLPLRKSPDPTVIYPRSADIKDYLAAKAEEELKRKQAEKEAQEAAVAKDDKAALAERTELAAEDIALSAIDAPAADRNAESLEDAVPPETVNISIGRGGTMAKALASLGLPPGEVSAAIKAISPILDLRFLRAEDRLIAIKSEPISHIELLRGIKDRYQLERDGASGRWQAHKVQISSTRLQKTVHGTVVSSLYQAIADAGEASGLATIFADIFSWEIDFFREVRAGDQFAMVIEREIVDGQPVPGSTKILAAAYNGAVGYHQAYRKDPNVDAYYDEKGQSVRKAFLRTPLKFARVTSNFGNRRHPLLGYTRKHNGIDYGVPIGTPVLSVADGTVIKVAQDNGAGKYIKVRYPNGYEALYAHLSAFNVRVGDRVSQKQVIGRTGNTGLSTGPHLHYGLKKGGKYINPATEKFPRGAALTSNEKAAFDEVIRQYQPLLMSGAPVKKTAELTNMVAEFEL